MSPPLLLCTFKRQLPKSTVDRDMISRYSTDILADPVLELCVADEEAMKMSEFYKLSTLFLWAVECLSRTTPNCSWKASFSSISEISVGAAKTLSETDTHVIARCFTMAMSPTQEV